MISEYWWAAHATVRSEPAPRPHPARQLVPWTEGGEWGAEQVTYRQHTAGPRCAMVWPEPGVRWRLPYVNCSQIEPDRDHYVTTRDLDLYEDGGPHGPPGTSARLHGVSNSTYSPSPA
jgi:hypothetical protein